MEVKTEITDPKIKQPSMLDDNFFVIAMITCKEQTK
jgi:hypothetical protein